MGHHAKLGQLPLAEGQSRRQATRAHLPCAPRWFKGEPDDESDDEGDGGMELIDVFGLDQILNVQVPFLFKEAVDMLNATAENVALVPVALLLACALPHFKRLYGRGPPLMLLVLRQMVQRGLERRVSQS